jgi:predicted ATPase
VLTELRLENFKRFKTEVAIPCSQLNLFTGINSKGKSTALQPLLLIHQSLVSGIGEIYSFDRILLNGPSVQVGSYRDLQHRDRRVDPVTIGFEFDADGMTSSARLVLAEVLGEQRWVRIQRLEIEQWKHRTLHSSRSLEAQPERPLVIVLDDELSGDLSSDLRAELRSLRNVHHIGADRMGPQEFYPRLNDGGFMTVGVRGERCAEALAWADSHQIGVSELLIAPNAENEARTVADQATAWLSYIFDGAMVRVGAPYATILTLEFNADRSAHYVRPINVGFGFSYILPILVAGLLAKSSERVVVENPEAHLHPMAQARLGEFLATVASTGVQVFVESHSEHLFNAFRLAVRDKKLTGSQLSVLYFTDGPPPILKIDVQDNGAVEFWPEGFFDQRLQDFARLFGR